MSTQFPSNSPQQLVGISVKTADYNVALSDNAFLLIMNSGSAHTFTLLATPPTRNGWFVYFQNIGAGTCTIARNGNNIDGAASNLTLATGTGVLIASDGTTYYTERGLSASTFDASAIVTGQLALARGGTGVDLSGSGGTTKILAQDASHVISARDLVAGDIPNIAESQVTNLTTDLAATEKTANKDAASGYAGLDSTTHLKVAEQQETVDARTSTSEAVSDSDRGKVVTFSNTSATAATIAQAGASSLFTAGWWVDIVNLNTGTVTLTPSTSTINGAATLVLQKGEGGRLLSDGSNYIFVAGQPTTDTPSDADVLTYVLADKRWESKSISTLGGANASQLRGKNISSATPTDQEVLKWSTADNQYDLVLADGLVHGDSIWDIDPVVVNVVDEFMGGQTATSGALSNLGWGNISSTGSAWTAVYEEGAPPHMGVMGMPWPTGGAGAFNAMQKMSAATNAGWIAALSPLLDYPGWKMQWVFQWSYTTAAIATLTEAAVINSSSKLQTYIGMGNAQPGSNTVGARPWMFVGLRFDTDGGAQQTNNSGAVTTPALQISDTTMKLECIANPFNLGNAQSDNAQGLKILQKIAAVSTGAIAQNSTLTAQFTTAINPNSMIVVVAAVGGTTAPTFSDSTSDTFSQNASQNDAGNAFSVYIFSAQTSSTGTTSSTNTITMTQKNAVAQSMAFTAYEVMSTQGGTITFDASAGSNGTGTAASTGNITLAGQDELVFEGTAVGTTIEAVSNAAGSGWLLDISQNVAGTPAGLFTLGSSYAQTTLESTKAGSATIALSKPWAQIAGAFKTSISSFFDTGITPTIGQWYRLELKCVTAGQVVATLYSNNVSYTHTFTVPKYTIGTLVANSGTAQASGTFGHFAPALVPNGSGASMRLPFASGSQITLAGLTGAGPSTLNGTWTVLTGVEGQSIGQAVSFYSSVASFGSTTSKGTVSGYPGYSPYVALGYPKISTGYTTDFRFLIDRYAFVWDTSLANSPLTMNANYSRYVSPDTNNG